jgi:hypothetical protein
MLVVLSGVYAEKPEEGAVRRGCFVSTNAETYDTICTSLPTEALSVVSVRTSVSSDEQAVSSMAEAINKMPIYFLLFLILSFF